MISFFSKPNVGMTKCFVEEDAQGLYLHLPIMILMMFNSMFFIITTSTLYMSKLTTHQARNARQKTNLQQVVPTRINEETREQLVSFPTFFLPQRRLKMSHITGFVQQAVHSDGHLVDIRVYPLPNPWGS